MKQLLAIIFVLTVSSIALMTVDVFVMEFMKKEEKMSIVIKILVCALTFCFWTCVCLFTWLVAFKYHEQSRQMLRIDKLTYQRLEKRNRRAVQGSSGDAPEHETTQDLESTETAEKTKGEMRDSVVVDDNRFVEFVQDRLKDKSYKYKRLRQVGVVTIIALCLVDTLISFEEEKSFWERN